ncbi:putative GNAT family acetyltransferase [Diaminobutyricimonas aerilata]|uniref:Putative GNAT family acetyltransferase n=1 Tax=Diaminobutyricimonas aerilata TaxID=1162967 RepID=A0A2M9CHR8_9MICO|nr:N-acetyltransferase [Diaminobutyricimonas aerilata]PJJ71464.1 putative GNAT family acetyltransferase [Diaminobutyricimonas aerilata]
MSRELTDTTGTSAIIDTVDDGPIRSYRVRLADDSVPAGRADFIEADAAERVRIFFHTEVDAASGGRGLAGLLVRTALSDAIDDGVVVVPVCRLFRAHLTKHGDAYLAEGGRFRAPSPADVALVGHAVRGTHRSS